LIIAKDKAAALQMLAANHSYLFSGFSTAKVRELLRQPDPAVVWHVEEIVDADGVRIPPDAANVLLVNRTVTPATRLTPGTRIAFVGAALVIDEQVLPGLSTRQIADYAVMRLFSKSDPNRLDATSPESVLMIIGAQADESIPLSLTRWDLALLKGLYENSGNAYAATQRAEIVASMRKELQSPTKWKNR
jgi:hypothetical protein